MREHMRWRDGRGRWGSWIGLVGVGLLSRVAVAADDTVKLKDGTTLSVTVLQRNSEQVLVAIPRAAVATINGEALPPPIAAGTLAPGFTAVDLNGATHSLADAKGQATLVKFWATWCPHCRNDIDLITSLFERYHEKGLRILAISIDQDVEQLRRFVKEQELPYTVISATDPSASEQQRRIPERYEMQGVPAYVVIDPHGVIADTFSGSVVETKRDLEGTLLKLLPGTSEAASSSPSQS